MYFHTFNLVGEAVKPTELGPEDLVAEAVEMCPDACCGKPVTECACGPDCKHCDCHEKNKATNETTVSSIDSLIEKAIDKLMGQFAESTDTCKHCGCEVGNPKSGCDCEEDCHAEADDTMDVKINQKGQLAKAGTPEPEEEQKTPIGEFILSYFDRENGTFPKGETAVLTMVEKDYGPQYVEPAAQFIEKVEAMVAERNAQKAEYSRYPETEVAKQQGEGEYRDARLATIRKDRTDRLNAIQKGRDDRQAELQKSRDERSIKNRKEAAINRIKNLAGLK